MAELVRVTRNELPALASMLRDFGREQVPFAVVAAMSRTASAVKVDLQAAMLTSFDRPTRWTLNSLWVETAKRKDANPTASVHFKDQAPKGVPAGRFLRAEILGGGRGQKSHEKALARAGIVPPGYFLVPTAHADLDGHGNMKTGQIVKILSSLRAFSDVGFTANASWGRKLKGVRRGESYFVIVPGRQQRGGLPPAIYKATGSGESRRIVPVAVLSGSPPRYAVRYDFPRLGEASVAKHLPALLQHALTEFPPRRR